MKFRLVSLLVYHVVQLVVSTLRLDIIGEDKILELQHRGSGVIIVSWHGRTLVPIARFRNRGYWAIISTSRDGEYQNGVFRRFGWNTVRGSTSARGAVQSALKMTKHLKTGATLAFTPDGPRGPSRKVQSGSIFLAQKSGCPIIPAGVSAAPRKLMSTWDRYLVPFPFARAAIVYGEPVYIPVEVQSDEEQHQWADRIEEAINTLEAKAEAMVGAQTSYDATQDVGQWHRV